MPNTVDGQKLPKVQKNQDQRLGYYSQNKDLSSLELYRVEFLSLLFLIA